MYEPDYGRFLSVDPLWGLYSSVQPYHYSLNQPLSQIDDGGKWVEAKTPEAQEAVRNSVPSRLRSAITFNSEGRLNTAPLMEAAQGEDPGSNIVRLSALASHDDGIEVHMLGNEDVADVTRYDQTGGLYNADATTRTAGFQFRFFNEDRTDGAAVGVTLPGVFDYGLPGMSTKKAYSKNENIQIFILGTNQGETGRTAAHEFVHAQLMLLLREGNYVEWEHREPAGDDTHWEKLIERAEQEAGE